MNRVYIRRRQYSESHFEWVIRGLISCRHDRRLKVTFSFSLGFYAFVLSEHSRY